MSDDEEEFCMNYSDFQREMREMDAVLSRTQKSVSQLLGEGNESVQQNKAGVLTLEQKRSRSQSSWARSKSAKIPMNRKSDVSTNEELFLDICKSERCIKTTAPSFTLGKRITSNRADNTQSDSCPTTLDYEVDNIDVLSTKKRPRASRFPLAPRMNNLLDSHSTHSPHSHEASHNRASTTPDEIDEEYEVVEVPLPSTGYSFGKDKRFPQTKKEGASVVNHGSESDEDEDHALSLSKADKWCKPRAQTTLMRPTSVKRPDTAEKSPPRPQRLNTQNIDVLSHRSRTPTMTMRPEGAKCSKQRTAAMEALTPGPGHYNVYNNIELKTKAAPVSVGVIYRAKSANKNETALRAKNAMGSNSLGPGAYDLDRGYHLVRSSAPMQVQMKAESKATPQLERKKYFEQKARDMRETHDNMHRPDDTILGPRTVTTSIAPPKSAFTLGSKEQRILSERQADRAERQRGTQYNVKYDFVEKRPAMSVAMASEIAARVSTKRQMEKPGVATALAEKSTSIKAAHKYYGPQIPVPWVKDKSSMARERYRGADSDDDGAASPTQEILRMLADRAEGNNFTSTKEDEEITRAFLRSSYSGAQHRKHNAVVMSEPGRHDQRTVGNRKLSAEEMDFDYLGAQLQPDWAGLADSRQQSHKYQSLKMDVGRGRDGLRVEQKGVAAVSSFASHRIKKDDDIGPGYYDTSSGLRIGEEGVKGVPFSKIIAREDQVGAFGEKPESAKPIDPLYDGDLYWDNEQLDLDHATAKDRQRKATDNKSFTLYNKERYPEAKPTTEPGQDNLGGTWFEGMSDAAKKKRAVEFSRMTGRSVTERDTQEDDLLEDMVGAPLPQRTGQIDLDVSDWKPHMRSEQSGAKFADPVKQPRFIEKESVGGDVLVIEPKYPQISQQNSAVVRMSRMVGREDANKEAEDSLLADERPDSQLGLDMHRERADNIDRAQRSTGRRVPTGVDMSKQKERWREEDAVEERLHNDEEMRVAADELRARQQRVGRGGASVADWDKALGRDDDEVVRVGDEEELILRPSAEHSSKHRRAISGPEWNKAAGGRFPEEDDHRRDEEKLLDLQDVDPGKFKKGLHGLNGGAASGVPTMANQTARVGDKMRDDQVMDRLTGASAKETLDLDPTDFGLRAKTPAITSMSNKQQRQPSRHEEKVLRSLREEEQEELVLEPNRDVGQKNTGAVGSGMANKAARGRTMVESVVEKELRRDLETELVLNPGDNPMRKSVPATSALRSSVPRTQTNHEMLAERVLRDEQPGELLLDPNDEALRNKVKGSTSLASKVTRGNTKDESQVLRNLRRETAEELIVEPDIRASRVSVPGHTSMANTASRLQSSRDHQTEQRLDQERQQELILDPSDQALRKNQRSATSLSASKSARDVAATPSQRAVKGDLRTEIDELGAGGTGVKSTRSKPMNSNSAKKPSSAAATAKGKAPQVKLTTSGTSKPVQQSKVAVTEAPPTPITLSVPEVKGKAPPLNKTTAFQSGNDLLSADQMMAAIDKQLENMDMNKTN